MKKEERRLWRECATYGFEGRFCSIQIDNLTPYGLVVVAALENNRETYSVLSVEPLAQEQRLKFSRLGEDCQPLANDSPSCSHLSSRYAQAW